MASDFKSQMLPSLEAAGIVPNGPNPWDLQIHNEKFWDRLLAEGSLGLGESYMDGWWDVADMAEFFNRILRSKAPEKLKLNPKLMWQYAQARFFNMQDIAKSKRVAHMHYSETEAYKASLDRRMAMWR